MEAIPDLPGLWSLTPWGMLGAWLTLTFLSFFRGWVVPKSTHERELAQERTRGDEWKETALAERAVNVEVRRQNTQLIEGQKTWEQFLRAAGPPFEETVPTKRGSP